MQNCAKARLGGRKPVDMFFFFVGHAHSHCPLFRLIGQCRTTKGSPIYVYGMRIEDCRRRCGHVMQIVRRTRKWSRTARNCHYLLKQKCLHGHRDFRGGAAGSGLGLLWFAQHVLRRNLGSIVSGNATV